MKDSSKGNIFLFIAAAVGGLGFVAMKNLLDSGYTPMQCVAGRYIIAVLSMSLFYFKQFKKITKEELKGGGIMGVLLFLLFAMLMEGLERTTPSVNAFLGCTTSLMVPIILFARYRKIPDIYVTLGSIMTLVGVAMLSLTEGLELSLGAILSLGASFMFGMQMVVMDRYVSTCDPVNLTLIESIVVMVLSIIVTLFAGETIPYPTEQDIIMFTFGGLFCTFIYFLLQSKGQKYTSPTITSIIITSEAVFAAIASFLFYGEKLGLRGVIGGIMIFAAVVIAEAKPEFLKQSILTYRAK